MRRDRIVHQTLESLVRSGATQVVDVHGRLHQAVTASQNGCVLRRSCDEDVTSHSYGSSNCSEEMTWVGLWSLTTLLFAEFRPELCAVTGLWDVTLVMPDGDHGDCEVRWSSLPTRSEASEVCARLNSLRRA